MLSQPGTEVAFPPVKRVVGPRVEYEVKSAPRLRVVESEEGVTKLQFTVDVLTPAWIFLSDFPSLFATLDWA